MRRLRAARSDGPRTAATASSVSLRIRSARESSLVPAGVSATWRLVRSKSLTPELRLEAGDRRGERRLRDLEPLRGAREVQLLGDRHEVAELPLLDPWHGKPARKVLAYHAHGLIAHGCRLSGGSMDRARCLCIGRTPHLACDIRPRRRTSSVASGKTLGRWIRGELSSRVEPGRTASETRPMSTDAQLLHLRPARRRATALARSRTARYILGVVVLAAGYYGAAKVGQTLRYTGSVSAIWPPAGLGIAALYLWGLRWWPGIFIGELIVNSELLLARPGVPARQHVGQQTGNMAEIVVGAALLRRLIGPRARARPRRARWSGCSSRSAIATAISATVGTISMLAGGVIDAVRRRRRSGARGGSAISSGALVVCRSLLVWSAAPAAAWRRLRTLEGALLLAAVVALGVVAVDDRGAASPTWSSRR